jgi:hypothetical protein
VDSPTALVFRGERTGLGNDAQPNPTVLIRRKGFAPTRRSREGYLASERKTGELVIELLRRLPRVGTRRGIRATLAGSGTFSFLYEVAHNPVSAFFAAFGSMVLLVYVEFGGPKRQRFEQHVGLIVVTFGFVVLGTLCSQVLWLAVASTVVVCFGILMSGVISSSLASATSAMLISFLLPVAFQGPLSNSRSSPRLGHRRRSIAGRSRLRVARPFDGSPRRRHGQRSRHDLYVLPIGRGSGIGFRAARIRRIQFFRRRHGIRTVTKRILFCSVSTGRSQCQRATPGHRN